MRLIYHAQIWPFNHRQFDFKKSRFCMHISAAKPKWNRHLCINPSRPWRYAVLKLGCGWNIDKIIWKWNGTLLRLHFCSWVSFHQLDHFNAICCLGTINIFAFRLLMYSMLHIIRLWPHIWISGLVRPCNVFLFNPFNAFCVIVWSDC